MSTDQSTPEPTWGHDFADQARALIARASEVAGRESILSAVSDAAEQLMRRHDEVGGINELLTRLGRAMGVSRAYIFENELDGGGRLCMSQRFEWVSTGVSAELDNPVLQRLPWDEGGFGNWRVALESGRIVNGLARDFEAPIRALLESQAIVSVLVVPVFVRDKWWGFIGFDDCRRERIWSSAELDALRAAAGIAGAWFERRRWECELREQRDLLTNVIEHIPLFVFWKDRDSVFLGCNGNMARAAGLKSPSEIVGKTDFDLPSASEEARYYIECDRRVMESGQPLLDIEAPHHRPDGSVVTLLTSKVPLRDASGKVAGILGIFADISDRKRAEDELRQAKDAAESASRAKSEFLANMSHEIRTPMTAILGFVELLADSTSDLTYGRRREYTETIRRNGEHLLAVINDILDISKIEAGRLEVQKTDVSPVSVIEEVASLMRVRAAEKGLPLTVRYTAPMPVTIRTDPTRLRQILMNLLSNAIKFTDHRETRIDARPVRGEDGIDRLHLDVVDTGVGLSESQCASLFKPFSQVDTSATRRFGGTGLGLCVSKRFAELLGGDIRVASTPGQGSTFTLLVDAGSLEGVEHVDVSASSRTGLEAQPVDERDVSLAGARILVAEDGPDNQRLIRYLLRRAGAVVTLVANGRAAVDAAEEAAAQACPFDLILMDMQMPEMNGYMAATNLRARGHVTPIIALTAHAMSGDREQCLAAGCDDYVTKPIHARVLCRLCAAWLARTAAGI